MRIVFAKGMLETMDYFTDQMVAACEKNNIDHYVIQINEISDPIGLFAFLNEPDCVALLFNQIGLWLAVDNENIWKHFGVPVYDFIVDHPRNFSEWFDDPVCDLRVIVLDNDHERFIRRFFPKIKEVYFMPDGGNEVDGAREYDDRDIDVLYVGSCQERVDSFPIIQFLPDGGGLLYQSAIKSMIEDPELSTEAAIDNYVSQYAPDLQYDELKNININFAIYIETFTRRYFKQLGMRALNEAGIEVEVYGDNWEDPDYKFGENIHIHNRVSSEECNRLAGCAKIGLNFMPWFKEGCSERVFNNMLGGAVSVTDTSRYLIENYTDGKDIVFFDMRYPQQLVEKVRWILSNPMEAKEIAKAGYKHAKETDSWEQRLKSFIDWV